MGRQGLLEPARQASSGFRIATGDPGAEVSFGQPPADREGKSRAVALTRVCEPALQRLGPPSPPALPAALYVVATNRPKQLQPLSARCELRLLLSRQSNKFAGGDHLRESDRDPLSRKAGPVAGAFKVPQSAAKPEVNQLSDRDDAIHHLRVPRYACRNALTTVRLGDASQ
jgi:hypothetical protein